MANDDSDIDALMSSVVGNSGEMVRFPTERARKTRERPPREARPKLAEATISMTEVLAAELEANDAEAAQVEEARKEIDPRTVPVRFSNLKHMAKSALHYWDAVQLDREDTLAMRLGRGVHAMVLGMPVVKFDGTRHPKSKKWIKFQTDNVGKEILSPSEWRKAEGVANAIRRHPTAGPMLLESGTVLEQLIEWEFLGRKCTSRPDARRGTEFICDLKTTQCAEPSKFSRDALFRGYNAQLAFYGSAVEYLTGVHIPKLYVAAVETKRPYAVTVLELDDETRLAGEKLCRIWFEQLLVCEASNHWPAYTDAIVTLGMDTHGTPDNPIDLDALDEALFA